MTGQFIHRNVDANFSEFLEDASAGHGPTASSNSIGATVQHSLPLAGTFEFPWNHLAYDYAYQDAYSAKNSGASTTVNGNASFRPTQQTGCGVQRATTTIACWASVPRADSEQRHGGEYGESGQFRSDTGGQRRATTRSSRTLGVHADSQSRASVVPGPELRRDAIRRRARITTSSARC